MLNKKIFRYPLIGVAILFCAYAAYWYWSALQLVTALDQDIAKLEKQGYDIRYDSQQTKGFPTRLKLLVRDMVIKRTNMENAPHLAELEKFSITTNVVNPITYLLNNMSGTEGGMDLSQLDVISFGAENIRFQKGSMAPLPDLIEELDLSVSGSGIMPVAGSQKEKMTKWQSSNGKIHIQDFALHWGELYMTAKGELGLDQALQIDGVVDTRTAGLPSFLRQLGQKGVLNSNTAILAAEGIQFFSVPDEVSLQGQRREFLTVPLVFQKGEMRLGPLKLLDIGPVAQ